LFTTWCKIILHIWHGLSANEERDFARLGQRLNRLNPSLEEALQLLSRLYLELRDGESIDETQLATLSGYRAAARLEIGTRLKSFRHAVDPEERRTAFISLRDELLRLAYANS
jgi:hypothetical protein